MSDRVRGSANRPPQFIDRNENKERRVQRGLPPLPRRRRRDWLELGWCSQSIRNSWLESYTTNRPSPASGTKNCELPVVA